ncbi:MULTISPECIES: FAD-dependent thymidylate synthase [Commensalibacter]|uniref:FAD-dependent thymidylate synthase n=1 Tax=Commensalibacter TaxID=1079922 RepID=UPI0012D931A3|nr:MULTISPECIES: FAD-dependent thymidylate synthase [Commensalibacter]MCT6842954.1 FAD-dependent thymidylate synthase [Commensalibacter sp.]MBH9972445.1 FAD-dependent thymidylate synthase [Commensalibacter melissae]MBI0018767.1 FAD-dependent thymidylate synthase [Commensalibacter sp. W8133]MBI0075059.1 FAD-dependent thymidylate synthase [Commensalibacter sp. M0357]MBI0083076.1 FAD-dependent thymidylate synthase [Commensalibacter sp. W6292M3]
MALTEEQQADIKAQSSQQLYTKRPISPGLEEMLYQAFPVLDHGFVRVVDYMGNDSAIVQAARVSYGTGTKKVSEDRGLIRYLMRHYHTTPFEMCEIKFHVKLPIFVARQWIRHRTASVNEYSARYSIMDREFYIPEPRVLAMQSKVNHQGRGEVLSADQSEAVLSLLRNDAQKCYDDYEKMLRTPEENGFGLARELARMNLTLNSYSQWYWKVNLHNLFHFLQLRIDSHAQYEIRVYAEVMLKTVRAWVPLACEAFEDYRKGAVTFSSTMMNVIGKLLNGQSVDQADSGLSKREWTEMMQILDHYKS